MTTVVSSELEVAQTRTVCNREERGSVLKVFADEEFKIVEYLTSNGEIKIKKNNMVIRASHDLHEFVVTNPDGHNKNAFTLVNGKENLPHILEIARQALKRALALLQKTC